MLTRATPIDCPCDLHSACGIPANATTVKVQALNLKSGWVGSGFVRVALERTLVVLLLLASGRASRAEEAQLPDVWNYYDYGEEAGWSNLNKEGETVSLIGCENSQGLYRFDFVGVFEAYAGDKSKQYWLTAGLKGELPESVYVYTSMEYFEFIFSFGIPKRIMPSQLSEKSLEFCARKIGQERQECQSFVGDNFSEVISRFAFLSSAITQSMARLRYPEATQSVFPQEINHSIHQDSCAIKPLSMNQSR